MKNLTFKNVRWYQNKNLDITNVPLVPAREAQIRRLDIEIPIIQRTKPIPPNPLASRQSPIHDPAPAPTQTIPARMVFHEANAALAPLTNGIQTQEQLCDLIEDLHELRYVNIFSSNQKTYSPFDWIACLVHGQSTKNCYANHQF